MKWNQGAGYGLVNKVTETRKNMYSRYYPQSPIFPPKKYAKIQNTWLPSEEIS